MSGLRVVTDVTCMGCACLCDDVTLHIDGERLLKVEPKCSLADEWFANGSDSSPRPAAQVDEIAIDLDWALDVAAELLAEARFPLVSGLTWLSCEGQRAALEFAETVGAAVEDWHAPKRFAAMFPRVGEVGCSWGEIRDRADLIVFWRPMAMLPRIQERFIEPARCRGAKVITVESKFDNDDLTVLWLMRGLARGRRLAAPPRIVELVKTFQKSSYGVFIEGMLGPYTVGLRALAQDLNHKRRFRCVTLGGYANLAGETQVATWQTGFPEGASFHRGYPSTGGISRSDSSDHRHHDVTISFATGVKADGFDLGPLAQYPRISVSSVNMTTAGYSSATFLTSFAGIHAPGTVFRGDGVALPLRPAFSSSFPDPTEVFRRLTQAVRARRP